MYLHIGMNVYLLSERIIGMFEVSQFQATTDSEFWRQVTIRNPGLEVSAIKSYILTSSQEIYCSNVHCRTLKKRWEKKN